MDTGAPRDNSIESNLMKRLLMIFYCGSKQKQRYPGGGLQPQTFWLTAQRANSLRHGDSGLTIFFFFNQI